MERTESSILPQGKRKRVLPAVEQRDGILDGVEGYKDRVDEHDEELVGAGAEARGGAVRVENKSAC